MFIHELTNVECHEVLQQSSVGHLACAHENQPFIVPINFAFDGQYLHGFSTVGQKIEWMRSNPLVCVEVDKVTRQNHWTSVIIFGRYEELPDTPEYERARTHARTYLQKRAMWWEPAFISHGYREKPGSRAPVFFRIHLDKMTGHRASFDDEELEDGNSEVEQKDAETAHLDT